MSGRRFPFAICVAFALIGVVLIIIGPADARVLGAIMLLFFGVGSLSLASPLVTRRGAGTVAIAEVGTERGFLLPVARLKAVMTIAACTGIAAAALLFWALVPAAWWIGIPGLTFFGGLALWRIALLPGRRGLALTPTRVKLLGWGDPELDWDDIRTVFLFEQSRNVMLGIRATEPGRVRRRRPNNMLVRWNRKFTGSDIAVPTGEFAGSPQHALEMLLTYKRDPARRGRLGTQDELDYLRVAGGGGLR
jgi:hypothetical protein